MKLKDAQLVTSALRDADSLVHALFDLSIPWSIEQESVLKNSRRLYRKALRVMRGANMRDAERKANPWLRVR